MRWAPDPIYLICKAPISCVSSKVQLLFPVLPHLQFQALSPHHLGLNKLWDIYLDPVWPGWTSSVAVTVRHVSSLFSARVSKQGALERVQNLPWCFLSKLPYQAVYLCSLVYFWVCHFHTLFPVFYISYSHLYFFPRSPELSNCSSDRNSSMTLFTLLCFSLPLSPLLCFLFQMGGTRTAHSIQVEVYHEFAGIIHSFM